MEKNYSKPQLIIVELSMISKTLCASTTVDQVVVDAEETWN